MSFCRVHWWMMRVLFLFLATPSARLRRSLRNYRLLPRLRSRSTLPERSTDLVGHDNWLKGRIYTSIYSTCLQCAGQVQVQSHKTDSFLDLNLVQAMANRDTKFDHRTQLLKTDLVCKEKCFFFIFLCFQWPPEVVSCTSSSQKWVWWTSCIRPLWDSSLDFLTFLWQGEDTQHWLL